MTPRLKTARRNSKFNLRGNNLLLQTLNDPEIVLVGPSETGKTIACLSKLNDLAWQYPGMQGAIVRKVFADMVSSVLQTFERKVLGKRSPVRIFGGEKAQWYDYPNGSRIWVGGMDKPGKVLSSERDLIFVNQAEELTLDDWETLSTRVTGRAGVLTHPQIIGDCNPAGHQHWILRRSREGRLNLLRTSHRDNPALFDDDGGLTEQGARTMERLSGLTGHRRKRLFEGEWASPEGLVYEEFSAENIVDAEPDSNLTIELGVDDGFIDPRAILFIQRSPERILVFDELYHSKHLGETCAREVLERCIGYAGKALPAELESADNGAVARWCAEVGVRLPEIAVGSPEAKELQARFRAADIPYRAKPHKVVEGIQAVRQFICDGQGNRTLFVNRRCKNLLTEIQEGYQYPPGGEQEKPADGNDHACDALRYWVYLRGRR